MHDPLPSGISLNRLSFHVQGGFIWLFYGSKTLPAEERPPIPCVAELEDPSWKPVYGEIEFECNHWSVFENAIDMAHIHYLHNDTFGNQVTVWQLHTWLCCLLIAGVLAVSHCLGDNVM